MKKLNFAYLEIKMEQKNFKILVMGAPDSGKTSFIDCIHGIFRQDKLIHDLNMYSYNFSDISKDNILRFREILTNETKNIQIAKYYYTNADLGIVLIPINNANGITDSIEYIAKFLEYNPGKPIIYVHSKCDLEDVTCMKYSDEDVALSVNIPDTVDYLLKKVCEKLNIPFTRNKAAKPSNGLMLIRLSEELTDEETKILDIAERAKVQIINRNN